MRIDGDGGGGRRPADGTTARVPARSGRAPSCTSRAPCDAPASIASTPAPAWRRPSQRRAGRSPRAELTAVNLAARIADGQQVVVPRRGPGGGAAGAPAGLGREAPVVRVAPPAESSSASRPRPPSSSRSSTESARPWPSASSSTATPQGGLTSLDQLGEVDGIGENAPRLAARGTPAVSERSGAEASRDPPAAAPGHVPGPASAARGALLPAALRRVTALPAARPWHVAIGSLAAGLALATASPAARSVVAAVTAGAPLRLPRTRARRAGCRPRPRRVGARRRSAARDRQPRCARRRRANRRGRGPSAQPATSVSLRRVGRGAGRRRAARRSSAPAPGAALGRGCPRVSGSATSCGCVGACASPATLARETSERLLRLRGAPADARHRG